MNARLMTSAISGALALICMTAVAETKVTVGVGHMCCGSCKTAATAAVAKVATDVSIETTNVKMTVKGDDLMPAMDALRKGGFPVTKIDMDGATSATVKVAHVCCGKCVQGLQTALTGAKLEDLDTDGMKVAQADGGTGTVTFKAKAGKTMNLMTVLAAMEKGGFTPTAISLSGGVAQTKKPASRVAVSLVRTPAVK
jgi:hypothetical protein